MIYHHHNNYVKPVFTKHIDINSINLIFEIGARECRYTNEFLHFFNNCTSIHSFECNPHTVDECIKNSSDPRITFNNVAISNKEGFITFNPTCTEGDFGFSSEFVPEGHEKNIKETIKVPCITLDSYVKAKQIKKINLLTMDIEGGELKAFEGATETLKITDNVLVEVSLTQRFGNGPLFDDITNVLKANNFKRVVYAGDEHVGDCLYRKK